MKEEDEINQMKEEGYHFVEQADGFRICLPLDNTPSGNYYEDGFSTGFKKESTLQRRKRGHNGLQCQAEKCVYMLQAVWLGLQSQRRMNVVPESSVTCKNRQA